MTYAARLCGWRELRHHFNTAKTRYVRNIPLGTRVEIIANDLRSSLCQRDCGSSANSAAGAGDKDHFSRVYSRSSPPRAELQRWRRSPRLKIVMKWLRFRANSNNAGIGQDADLDAARLSRRWNWVRSFGMISKFRRRH
jgi:hypothetical protein